jgi:uncharacterized membrane protein YdjX (TVP38/TMEM64 family)
MTAPRTRLLMAGLLLVMVVVAVLVLPVPSALQMRAWAQSVGIVAPMLFLFGQTLVTVTPIPRTAFTLAAGLLFGPVLGVALSLTATTSAAILAFVVVRRLGRDLVQSHLDCRVLRAVDARLCRRGWLAVASLRLIPAVPFSVLNYCSAVSSIRFRDYLVGTVGVIPGSVAIVLLGDALTGTISPALFAVSLGGAAIGVVGLIVQARSAPSTQLGAAGPDTPSGVGPRR